MSNTGPQGGPYARPLKIHNLDRTGDEMCAIRSKTEQSLAAGDYYTSNYHHYNPHGVLGAAYQEPTVMPWDGYGVGGRTIESDSKLRILQTQTRVAAPMHPQGRPIKTVPYMGGGRGNPFMESLLQQSEMVRDRKSTATVSDVFYQQHFTPMIPLLRKNIQDPHHYVEEINDPTWVRGGAMSRNIVRDQLCMNENNAPRHFN